MKKPALHWIAAPLMAFGVIGTASASVVCLAPNPVCATVVVGGLVASAVSAPEDRAPRSLRIGRQREALAAIVDDIESAENERLHIRIREAARYNPGYEAIVRRYENDRHEGSMSLQSLQDFDPRIFEDLDRIADIIGRQYPRDVMLEVYGPKQREDGRINWSRYATLAREALVIHRHFFAGG